MKPLRTTQPARPAPAIAEAIAHLAAGLKATAARTSRASEDANEASRALARADREHEHALGRLMSPRVRREFEAQKARWRKRLVSLSRENGPAPETDLARVRAEARAALESFLRAAKVDVPALRRAIKRQNADRAAALRAAFRSTSTPDPR